jgi:type III secretion protein J
MRDEALPRPKSSGVLDAVGKGALVPSEAAEHAEVTAGIAGDLERTLESTEGVLSARVHLSVPEAEPFAREPSRPRPSASVLLEHQGAAPPIAVDSVQRLVAGAVAGMLPSDVAVVTISRPAPADAPPLSVMSRVGPIAVARGSARALQAALVVLLGLIATLAAVTIFLYTRLTRLRRELRKAR